MAVRKTSKARATKAGAGSRGARAARGGQAAAMPKRAARVALKQATEVIRRLQRNTSRNFWAIGRRLAQVAEFQLHKAGGFDTLDRYAEEVLDLTRGTAFQYMRVATAFSEEVAATFGPEKLDRALAYIAKTPEDEAPGEIPRLKVRVPAERGKGVVAKAFAEVTTAELRRAVQHAGHGRAKKRNGAGLPEAAALVIAKADKALDRAVGRGSAREADVVARAVNGDVRVDVRGVPLARARAAFSAVAKALGSR
jgi:hypothetical protein